MNVACGSGQVNPATGLAPRDLDGGYGIVWIVRQSLLQRYDLNTVRQINTNGNITFRGAPNAQAG